MSTRSSNLIWRGQVKRQDFAKLTQICATRRISSYADIPASVMRTDGLRVSSREIRDTAKEPGLRAATAILVTIILAITLSGCSPAKPQAMTVASGGLAAHHAVIFGISDPAILNEPSRTQRTQLARMKTLGITSVRFDANWASVQAHGPQNFNWLQLDRAVDSVLAAGMSIDLIIDGCPPWAAVPGAGGNSFAQPASTNRFAAWAADVAARYAPKGVKIFEIWNEPNIKMFWWPRPNPSAYTADLRAAYSSIKRVDPSAFVVTGGLSPSISGSHNYSPIAFLRAMYAAGAKGHFDALGYHPYSFPALPDTPDPMSGWSQMNYVYPSLRSVMVSHGDAHKSIWITEFGAPSGGPSGVGQIAQARGLTEAISSAKATKWIESVYIYTWQDSGSDQAKSEEWFGLVTAQGSEKLAYIRVRNAIKSRLSAPLQQVADDPAPACSQPLCCRRGCLTVACGHHLHDPARCT